MLEIEDNFRQIIIDKYPILQVFSKISIDGNNFLNLDDSLEDIRILSDCAKENVNSLKILIANYQDEFKSLFKSNITLKLIHKNECLNISYPTNMLNAFEVYYSKDKNILFNIPTPKNIEEFSLFEKEYLAFKQDLKIFENNKYLSTFFDNLKFSLDCLENISKVYFVYQLNIRLIQNKDKFKLKFLQSIFQKVHFNSLSDYVHQIKPILGDKKYKLNFVSYYFDHEHIHFITNVLKVYNCPENNGIIYNLNGVDVNGKIPISCFNFQGEIISTKNTLNKAGLRLSNSGRCSYIFLLKYFEKEIIQYNIKEF